MPELGYYTYQWFLDGDSIDGDPSRPFILMKNSLVPGGVYTVAVSNENCTKISDGFIWNPTGIKDMTFSSLEIYPNPSHDVFYMKNINISEVNEITITDFKR